MGECRVMSDRRKTQRLNVKDRRALVDRRRKKPFEILRIIIEQISQMKLSDYVRKIFFYLFNII